VTWCHQRWIVKKQEQKNHAYLWRRVGNVSLYWILMKYWRHLEILVSQHNDDTALLPFPVLNGDGLAAEWVIVAEDIYFVW
jgi:hypothetical protein